MSEEEWLEIYGKGLKEEESKIKLRGSQQWWNDDGPYDEKGRWICNHDEEGHNYFDYNDYKYIDNELKHCGASVDWVKKGKVGTPKQQSTCGSCWAHSTIASVETLHAILTDAKHPDNVTTFSEQQLVDCDFLPNLGCLGGRRQFSFDYVTREGLTTAAKYPYKNKQDECSYNAATDQVFKIDSFKAWERPTTEDMEKLVCQGTVSVSIRINDCIKLYKSGIIYDGDSVCGCGNIGGTNHAVAIVGYGVEHENEVCKKYWIVKNSWGSDWGEGGFFRLCREDEKMAQGTCNIRTDPMIALVNKSE